MSTSPEPIIKTRTKNQRTRLEWECLGSPTPKQSRKPGRRVKKGIPKAPINEFNVQSKFKDATALLINVLAEFDTQVIKDSQQLRTYITNKLLHITQCGDTKDELKALELLGKSSDVGLFVEKSEIEIRHTTSAVLESTIAKRITALLGNSSAMEEAEFTEVATQDVFTE